MSPRLTLRIAAGLTLVGIAIAPSVGIAAPPARATCGTPEQLTPENRQLLAKAAQGGAELRRYVWRTKPIYNRDLSEIVPWLEARDQAARSGCPTAATEASPQQQPRS